MPRKISLREYFKSFIPRSFVCLKKGYTLKLFRGDLLGGVTAGVIAFPVAMAFAIASGLDPQQGLFTSIVAGFLIAMLGGTYGQVSGTAAAFIAVVYDVVRRQGYDGLVYATLIAGVILILAGLGRLGNLIKFLPKPLISGLTAGIAVVVFSSQIKEFFGFAIQQMPAGFIGKWKVILLNASSYDATTTAVALGTLIAILLIRRFVPVIPWALGSIAVATGAVWFFHLPVETIATKYGFLPSSLPSPGLPKIDFTMQSFRQLFPDALTIAFLAGSKSLLSAVIADGITGRRHKANGELVAVGIGNIASVFFGGLPACAVIARTAANIKSGGKTPFSGMIHSLVLLIIIFIAAPVMSLMPLPALSAILVVVAFTMFKFQHIRHLFKAPAGDILVFLSAFFLTILVDVTVAVEVGMVLAAFYFIREMATVTRVAPAPHLFVEDDHEFEDNGESDILKKRVPEGVAVYEIQGPFFFGTANMLRSTMDEFDFPPKVFILRMSHVDMLDASGMYALRDFFSSCQKQKTQLFLSEIPRTCYKTLKRFEMVKKVGKENLFKTLDEALLAAEQVVETS